MGLGDNSSAARLEGREGEKKQNQNKKTGINASGLLPTIQLYEFYLIKSIKVGNRFKDFG